MDGKIAIKTGRSKWITGEEARRQVQEDMSLIYIFFKLKELGKAGITVINCCPEERITESGVDLQKLMTILGERGIDSILLEGGGTLNESALKAGIVNEIDAFIAPKIFAGNAKTPVMGLGVDNPEDAYRCEIKDVEQIGEDILIRYVVSGKTVRLTDVLEFHRGRLLPARTVPGG